MIHTAHQNPARCGAEHVHAMLLHQHKQTTMQGMHATCKPPLVPMAKTNEDATCSIKEVQAKLHMHTMLGTRSWLFS